MYDSTETSTHLVAQFLLEGTVIPFLGAGVNLMSRAGDENFERGRVLPSSSELAGDLADYFEYPESGRDLMRVSQYVDMVAGSGELYRRLHRVFDADYPPTPLHHLLARLPAMMRSRGSSVGLVVVTTNYDDSLERAFAAANEAFDLVYYIADGPDHGRFAHVRPDGTTKRIDRPNQYHQLDAGLPLIAKFHGAVNRADPDQDSYVITEDHYIDYLTRTDISGLLPVHLANRLKNSHFLFLGYSLKDWNLRVVLHRIWMQQRLTLNSWAVQLDPKPLDQKWWGRQGVELIPSRLDEYVANLTQSIDRIRAGELT